MIQSVTFAPNWPENHLLLAEAYYNDARFEEAEAEMAKAKVCLEHHTVQGWRSYFVNRVKSLEEKLSD